MSEDHLTSPSALFVYDVMKKKKMASHARQVNCYSEWIVLRVLVEERAYHSVTTVDFGSIVIRRLTLVSINLATEMTMICDSL